MTRRPLCPIMVQNAITKICILFFGTAFRTGKSLSGPSQVSVSITFEPLAPVMRYVFVSHLFGASIWPLPVVPDVIYLFPFVTAGTSECQLDEPAGAVKAVEGPCRQGQG